MEPRDIFGLSILIYVIKYLVYGATTIAWLPGVGPVNMSGYWTTGGIYLIVGLYLLRGAPLLIRFAYPPTTRADTENPNKAAHTDC